LRDCLSDMKVYSKIPSRFTSYKICSWTRR